MCGSGLTCVFLLNSLKTPHLPSTGACNRAHHPGISQDVGVGPTVTKRCRRERSGGEHFGRSIVPLPIYPEGFEAEKIGEGGACLLHSLSTRCLGSFQKALCVT